MIATDRFYHDGLLRPRRDGEPMTTPTPLRPTQALAIYFASFAAFLVIGPLAIPLGLGGLAVAHLVSVLGVPLLAVGLARAPIRTSFGLLRPGALACAGAIAIGVSFWYVNLAVLGPIAERLLAPGESEQLTETFLAPEVPLVLLLLVTAVVPAIGEELLMRGVILRPFQQRFGRLAAIAISALLFGILHLSAARMLMTTTLGILLADVAIASGSVIPAVIVHALNNTMAVLTGVGALPWLTEAAERGPELTLAAAALLTVAGLALVHVGGRTDRHRDRMRAL